MTSGFERLQRSKINALGIAHQFTAIHVDAIDAPARKGKRKLFEQIINRHQFDPEVVLVIGDNEHSEILAAREFGIRTVQTLRPDVARSEKATYHVSGLEALKKLLETELAKF